ncbi:hypothetical protein RB601_003233 [Gaeumannomyces tritici]
MPIAVLPALIPDIPRLYEIYFASFKNDMMGRVIVDILFPGGKTDTAEFRDAHARATLDWWHKCDHQYTLKCVDTDTGDIVGMGLGDAHFRERSAEERKFEGCAWLEGKERERADAVLVPLAEMRERLWGGQRYIYVHVIAVDPKHQGRGAGKAFIEWALATGEACGVPVYFESSPSTVKLYERMGFSRIRDKISHKGKVLGLPLVTVDVPLMVFMPSAAGGLTFDQWRDAGYPKFGSEAARRVKAEVGAGGGGGRSAKVPVETSSAASSEGLKADAGGRRRWWKKLIK